MNEIEHEDPEKYDLCSRVDRLDKMYDSASIFQPLEIKKQIPMNPEIFRMQQKVYHPYQNQNEIPTLHDENKES